MKKRFQLYFIVILLLPFAFIVEDVSAQSFPVIPKGFVSSGSGTRIDAKILFHPDSTLFLEWAGNINGNGFEIKLGSNSGNYNYQSSYFPMDISGTDIGEGMFRQSFIPSNVALPVGRYYGIVTNSQYDNLNDIVNDQNALFSNEFQFVVEATSAPVAIAPLGTIDNPTPVFQWSSVSGVVSYWLLLSSNPFEISTDSLGNIKIVGANLVWNYTTNQTSAQYGDVNPLNPYDQGTPPPLLPGQTYNYVILNLYEENNPIFGSPITSGVYSFTYDNGTQQVPPNLYTPADSSTFEADQTITFTWEAVDWANSYSLYLYQRLTSFGGNDQTIDVPIWNTTTTNTLVDFDAGSSLNKGTYVWFVVPNDAQGAGTSSETFLFNYNKVLGTFRLQAKSTLDNTSLLNYQAQAVAVQDGITPANPFLVIDSETYIDSLVTGTYQFTGSKVGYLDTTVTVTITADNTLASPANIVFPLTPLPALISGTVLESGTSQPVSNANVVLTNTATGDAVSTVTSSNGLYSVSTVIGSYTLQVSKPGYLSSDVIYLNLPSGQTIVNDILLIKDESFVSGKIFNDLGEPIQLASVTATKGNTVQQTSSNGDGNYSFTLSSGNWNIEVSKLGFISPEPLSVNLATGDNLQNQNLSLIPRANQVSGIVYKTIDLGDGQTSNIPFQNVTVTATPIAGTPSTTQTDASGNYIFSLRQGTYVFSVSKNGYTPSDPIQLSLAVGETVDNIQFTLTPNPASVSGQVKLSDGTSISGALVEVQGIATTTTDVNGLYTLSLPEGTHIINVSKNGYISPSPFSISLSPGDNFAGIDFLMTPNAGTIAGKVTSGGLALSGATVYFISGNDTLTTTTDNYGNYSKSLQPASWVVFAGKPGFVNSSQITINIAPGQTSANNNFSLVQNTAIVTGVVLSGSSALRNANVSIYNNVTNILVSNTVSNASGSFSSSLEAGNSYRILVSKTGYSSDTKTTDVLQPQSSVSLSFLLAANPSSITGTVYSSAQTVLSGIKVYLYNSNGIKSDSATTNQNGEYLFGVSAGDFTVTAGQPGYITASTDVSVTVGQNLADVNLTLTENFASINGVVSNSQGTGIEGVMVNLTSVQNGKTTFSLSDGSYLLNRLVGGSYSLGFTKSGFSDTLVTSLVISDGDSRTINVNLVILNGTLNGQTKTVTGEVLPDATIQIQPQGKTSIYASSDENGNYSVNSLSAGNYSVTASKAGYRSSQVTTFTISSTDSVVTVNFYDFQKNTAEINGTVSDASSGLPLANVQVSLSGDNGSVTAQSSSSGLYNLTNLFPGNYTLSAELQNYDVAPINITIVDTATLIIQNIAMSKITGTISGSVVNQVGSPLAFTVPVKAVSGNNLYAVQTDATGNFFFSDVSPDSGYTVYTDIYAEGFVNAVMENVIVSADANTNVGQLTVQQNTAKISGNTGTDNVSITLYDNSSNIVNIAQSDLSGGYQFNYLSSGSYRLVPSKAGFIFTPSEQNVAVAIGEEKTADFSATPNIADLLVHSSDDNGTPLAQVNVTIVNSDTNFILSQNSDVSGDALFTGIPSDTYIVTPSLSGYSATPVNKNIVLNAGDSKTVQFTFTPNSASVSGKVSKVTISGSTVPLPGASVEAKRLSSGQTFRSQTDSSGNYTINNLPKDIFVLTAGKTGFVTNTEQVDLSGGNADNIDFTLEPKIVRLHGVVISANQDDIVGLQIDAVSNFGDFLAVTDQNGEYVFDELPIGVEEGDTTTYNISVNGKGVSQIVRIPASMVNTTFEASNFLLPSGKISIRITECSQPLEDAGVTIIKPDGTTINKTTDENGEVVTESNLRRGEYSIHPSKPNYLIPQKLSLSLISDTSSVDFQINMPFTFIAPNEAFANQPILIHVNNNGNCSLGSDAAAKIYYKLASNSEFIQVEMALTDTSFDGEIPPLYSTEEIDYYIKAVSDSITYKSDEYKITPKAAGILSSLSLNPALNNVILRPGDDYEIRLILLDGIQKSLKDKFIGASHQGYLIFSASSNLELVFADNEDSTNFKIHVLEPGESSISVTAFLEGVNIEKSASFTVGELNITSLSIASPQTRISNRSAGIQFSISASDSSGRTITLGQNVEWDVSPASSISDTGYTVFRSTGFYKPIDETFFGNVKITANDEISGLSAETEVSVYAEVFPNTTVTLSDNDGFILQLPSNAVNIPIQIEFARRSVKSVKKYITPIGSNQKYIAADKSYALSYSATTALPGDSLMAYGTIDLPASESNDLLSGNRALAYYDIIANNWRLLSNSALNKNGFSSGGSYSYNRFNKFGEYIIVSQSEPLSIKYSAVLPSPFSPDVAPVKIGYFLTSDAPPATVNIKIYNVNGILIKTLLDNDIQFPGKYGGKSSMKEITWDGTTNSGSMARNGRYIIRIHAKDGMNEVSELLQVVLIK